MEILTDPEVWLAFLTLTVLEIVLGIDNIIFISVLTGRLPEADRARGRFFGLALAMLMRIGLLLSLTWVMKLTDDLFTVFEQAISGRDLILILGGAFLIAKSTQEVHNSLEGMADEHNAAGTATFSSVLVQIGVIDIVFSLDSVITAVGLVQHVGCGAFSAPSAIPSSSCRPRFMSPVPTARARPLLSCAQFWKLQDCAYTSIPRRISCVSTSAFVSAARVRDGSPWTKSSAARSTNASASTPVRPLRCSR